MSSGRSWSSRGREFRRRIDGRGAFGLRLSDCGHGHAALFGIRARSGRSGRFWGRRNCWQGTQSGTFTLGQVPLGLELGRQCQACFRRRKIWRLGRCATDMGIAQVLARRGRTQFGDLATFEVMPPAGYGIRCILVLAGRQQRRSQQQEERDFSRSPACCRCHGLRAVPWGHFAVPAVCRMSKCGGD